MSFAALHRLHLFRSGRPFQQRVHGVPVALGVVLAMTSFGCGAEHNPSIGTREQPVLEGQPSERSSVVMVQGTAPDHGNYCSGTLIAPNVVVTARHCVSPFTEGDYSCTIDGAIDLSRTRSPASAGDMGLPYPPEQIAIHAEQAPDFEVPTTYARLVVAPETSTICRNDIAFLVLKDELDASVAKVRLDSGILPQETVTVVGFGINDVSRTERTERSGVAIHAVGPSEFYEVEGNAMPRTFVVGRSVCPGDSGGPAFSDETNELLGAFSLFRGDCTSSETRNFFSQLAPYREFAVEAFAEAGYSDLLDEESTTSEPSAGEPAASGAAGASSSEKPTTAASNAGGCSLGRSRSKNATGAFWLLALFLVFHRRILGSPRFSAAKRPPQV